MVQKRAKRTGLIIFLMVSIIAVIGSSSYFVYTLISKQQNTPPSTEEGQVNNLTINYNPNNGTGSMSPTGPVNYNQNITVSSNTYTAPTGKRFVAWNTQADGLGTPVLAGSQTVASLWSYATGSNNRTLTIYAIWVDQDKYSITYWLDGGSFSDLVQVFNESDLSIPLPSGTKSGYAFGGWFDSSTFSGPPITQVTTTGDKEYWALFTPYILTIIYNSHGGTSYSLDTVEYDETITLPTPTKSEHFFIGWTGGNLINASGSKTGQQILSTLADGNQSVTLDAQWTANTLTITYNANGGNGSMSPTAPASFGGTITVSDNGFNAPSGKIFAGWNTQSNGGGTPVAVDSHSVASLWGDATGTGNKTLALYAQWTDPPNTNTLTITYACGEGDVLGSAPATPTSAVYGTAISFPVNVYTQEYYVFVGWQVSGEGAKEQLWETGTKTPADLSTAIETGPATVLLTAVWDEEVPTGVLASALGMVPRSVSMTYQTAQDNHGKLITAINAGYRILVDDEYSVRIVSGSVNNLVDPSVTELFIVGVTENAAFYSQGNGVLINLRDATSLQRIRIHKMNFISATSNGVESITNRFSFITFGGSNAPNLKSLDRVDFTYNSLKGGGGDVSFFAGRSNPLLDPENKGIGLLNILNNKFEYTFVQGTFHFTDTVIHTTNIKNNEVHNMGGVLFYASITGKNGTDDDDDDEEENTPAAPYNSEIRARRLYFNIENNYIKNDDDFNQVEIAINNGWGGNVYHAFITVKAFMYTVYKGNHIEGLKYLHPQSPPSGWTRSAVYDAYLSVANLVHEDNYWKNNLSFYANKTHYPIVKSKGGQNKWVSNNTFIVEDDFPERVLGKTKYDLLTLDEKIQMFRVGMPTQYGLDIVRQGGSIGEYYEFVNNIINVYSLDFFHTLNLGNMKFAENTIDARYPARTLVISSTNTSYYRASLIHITPGNTTTGDRKYEFVNNTVNFENENPSIGLPNISSGEQPTHSNENAGLWFVTGTTNVLNGKVEVSVRDNVLNLANYFRGIYSVALTSSTPSDTSIRENLFINIDDNVVTYTGKDESENLFMFTRTTTLGSVASFKDNCFSFQKNPNGDYLNELQLFRMRGDAAPFGVYEFDLKFEDFEESMIKFFKTITSPQSIRATRVKISLTSNDPTYNDDFSVEFELQSSNIRFFDDTEIWRTFNIHSSSHANATLLSTGTQGNFSIRYINRPGTDHRAAVELVSTAQNINLDLKIKIEITPLT